jgi:beta-phosphoglucomutase family hydrolase
MDAVPALIFDMDGVIVNSTPMHTRAWTAYLSDLGLPAGNLSDRMLGKHNDEIVRDLLASDLLTEELVVEHGKRKEALYRDMMAPVLEENLVPGVHQFIARYGETPLAVATNAEAANVAFVLDGAGLRQYFRVIIDGQQVARPKPHPDIYLEAARLLGVAPQDCIIFEDSLTGVEAARAAGARVVGLATTLSELPHVDLTIQDFLDPALEPWLQGTPVSRSSS